MRRISSVNLHLTALTLRRFVFRSTTAYNRFFYLPFFVPAFFFLFMASPTCTDHLCKISSDTWFVLGAYFFAFFPWVVLSNTDYITEKWRTVRRTRVLARYHLVFSIGPMMYVGVYAEAQRRVGDSKELGAALAALFLNLIHFVRTVWGMAQVNAFVAWCKEAMECLRAMQGNDDDCMSEYSDSENSDLGEDKDDEKSLQEKLMVNNTVVDNELGGTDLSVTVSWRKAWEALKKWELKPSAWLVTEHPQLCTMRWAGAFLCGVGHMWCGGRYLYWTRPSEALNSFYSSEMYNVRSFLERVTRKVKREGNDATIVSCFDESRDVGQGTAYARKDPSTFILDGFESFIFESDSLRSSYPVRTFSHTSSDNRELAVAGLAESVVLAINLGTKKLAEMRRHFEHARPPTNFIWSNGWDLLLEQCRSTPPEVSALVDMCTHFGRIPFPYRLQMVALWDECTNWRILQASAHCDIQASIDNHNLEEESLFEIEPLPADMFEYCRAQGKNKFIHRCFSFGVVLETVRTFLGEWLSSGPEAVDWEPLICGESFEFVVSEHLATERKYNHRYRRRFVWECQRALQSELANGWTEYHNLPSSITLIMLFILSMPSINVDEEEGKDDEGTDGKRDNRESSSIQGGEHSIVNVSVGIWRIWSQLAPQNISIIVRFDEETGRASLKLRFNESNTRFHWQHWLDAVTGYMSGIRETIGDEEEESEKRLRKVDLRKSMVELSPFYCEDEDSVMETGTVRVWMGWPAFDMRVCKFEIDQWMRACNIDVNNLELDAGNDMDTADKQVVRGAVTIEDVMGSGLFDGDDE